MAVPTHPERSRQTAIVVTLQTPELQDEELARSLAELQQLLHGLGIAVEDVVIQRKPNRGAPTYLGEGKLRELAARAGGLGAIPRGTPPAMTPPAGEVRRLVVVDDELSPAQQRGLELATGTEVLDRTAVILRVFEQRARTPEARLEVELARLQYELPRVRDDHSLGAREGGGGRASRGHSNVELAKQRARERIAAIRRELASLRVASAMRRQRRAESSRVALIGYTNSGKSSVMRLLTGSDVLVEDKLFATLGTTVRRLPPPCTPPILLADTVGFLNRLPHALVASFRSTLDEVHEASLLLYVVDAADPCFRHQLEVTRSVVAELCAEMTPARLVLNKADKLTVVEREALAREFPDALQLCAHDPADGVRLRERIVAFFDERLVAERLELPWARHGVLAEMREEVRVEAEEYGEAVVVQVRATPEALARLKKRLA